MKTEYAVTVYGRRNFLCGANFRNERKARDYYAEMLVKYPDYTVIFEKNDDTETDSEN